MEQVQVGEFLLEIVSRGVVEAGADLAQQVIDVCAGAGAATSDAPLRR